MAIISRASSQVVRLHSNQVSTNGSSWILHCRSYITPTVRFSALRTASDRAEVGTENLYGPNLLKKPVVSQPLDEEDKDDDDDEEIESEWVDWEDQILQETVPLVGLVRMTLHSGKYKSGERLSPDHQKTISERLLPYHPSYETKIGCGIDYISVGHHPDFNSTRCLFIVRHDGESIDFSYWKCIKGLIRKKYPLFAESFILRHFRRRPTFNKRKSRMNKQ